MRHEDELLKHTPKTFVQAHRHDERTIRAVKALVLERCQSYLRADTVLALSETSGPEAQRFTDALYRIWCFCKIFGCEKGREDDITGQIDWLKGGVLAHQDNCVATVNTNLEFDMSSVLLNAPDHFAKGNAGGLSTEQLYDIIELWNCLSALLQGYQGRTEQARKAGIFDHADVPEGDVEKEDAVVEEWLSYVLTLGLPTILQLARLSTDQSDAGFALAKARRWADWTPLTAPSTRSTFLKEPVARLYEERTATRLLKSQDPRSVAKKEMSRRRVASLAAEIKLARNASGYKRLPLIDMATERPMSVLSRRDSVASSSFSSSHFPSHPPSHFASPAASPPMSSSSASASSFSSSFAPAPRRATDPAINVYVNGRPMSPTWQSPRRVSPIIEDRVETFNRMSMQSFNGVAEDTSERAVRKIVEMGFSAAEAREALRMTDMGDGLRVDRAVDLLIRKV
ncbi:hypothetical protein H2203_006185 [Taxawa tesnikishii (nom. ined.)]|nr:hypothetical protein H2203_006185 [Dothideales sp. JES 119]